MLICCLYSQRWLLMDLKLKYVHIIWPLLQSFSLLRTKQASSVTFLLHIFLSRRSSLQVVFLLRHSCVPTWFLGRCSPVGYKNFPTLSFYCISTILFACAFIFRVAFSMLISVQFKSEQTNTTRKNSSTFIAGEK
jgi:hypothetical protein